MAEPEGDPRTPEPPPGWSTRPGLRERIASKLTGRGYVALEYPPPDQDEPRWGWTRPPHPLLAEMLRARRDVFAQELERVAGRAGELARLPLWGQHWFTGLDAAVLYDRLRARDPARLIEVGSGHSTLFAARAVADGGLRTHITSIDPSPRAEVDEVCDEVVRQPFERTGLDRFWELGRGDMVFVDSSHVALRGSDVSAFFIDVLPALPPGVLLGIHDVFLPDDYPWWLADRWYSEQYLLAAWLLGGGGSAEIAFAAHFAATDAELRPLADEALSSVDTLAYGSSFWLEVAG